MTAIPVTTITTTTSTSTTISTVETQSTNATTDLAKDMEDLSTKGQEIKKLRTQLNNLQEKKLKIDNVYLAEIQKTHNLTHRIEFLEN